MWSIPPERARRVGHPAPFPVELPSRLIQLYTYRDDLVLDPFMGSGSALVAAARLGRRYVGYDLDPAYAELARRRVAEDGAVRDHSPGAGGDSLGRRAMAALVDAGFTAIETDRRVKNSGVVVPFVARDAAGDVWRFDLAGAATSWRSGLSSMDVTLRALGRAAALGASTPIVVLTTDLPDRRSPPDQALRSAGSGVVFDVIDLGAPAALDRLRRYAMGQAATAARLLGPGTGRAASRSRERPRPEAGLRTCAPRWVGAAGQEKLWPQPQVRVALGFVMAKPDCSRPSL